MERSSKRTEDAAVSLTSSGEPTDLPVFSQSCGKTSAFAGCAVAGRRSGWLDAAVPRARVSARRSVQGNGDGSCCREEGVVRGLLLQVQPPLRARSRRAVRDVPPGPPRRAAPPAPAALHVPP